MQRGEIGFGGAGFVADVSGALWWPDRRMLAVADLHLEKGSRWAMRTRQFLPPYDSAATLARLAAVVQRFDPAIVACLGDSFDDGGGPARLAPVDRAAIGALAAGREWIWIAGNHDPQPPADLAGAVCEELRVDGLVFRHAAQRQAAGEISGHYHPKAAVAVRHSRVVGRCFAVDGRRIILPAFGAYTGGLDVLDPVVAALFGPGFEVLLIGGARLHRFPGARLCAIAPLAADTAA